MPIRKHDAHWAVAVDLMLVDEGRSRIALIRRENENVLALVGEKLQWNETGAMGFRRAFYEELGIIDMMDAGIKSWRLAGLFGLHVPDRDPRFLQGDDGTEKAQILSLVYLIEADLDRLQKAARPGSSVVALEMVGLDHLPPLFLDHSSIIRQVLQAEQEGRLPLLPDGEEYII